MKRALFLILIMPFISNASPWVNSDEMRLRLKIESLSLCGINLPNLNHFPYNLSNIYNEIDTSNLSDQPEKCIKLISDLETYVENEIPKKTLKFGIQSKGSDQRLVDFGKKSLHESNAYFILENTSENWSVRIQGTKLNKEGKAINRFDESYIAYTFNNKVITLGRVSKWWSPSWDTSLILSNNSRPIPILSFSNNLAFSIELPLVRLLGPMNYEFFLGQLEENRSVPEAKILGTRLSFNPKPRFNFSLFRTGQFGGEGRPEDLKTLGKFFLGQDNVGFDGVTSENQPGNQLAGIDFKIKLLKRNNLELFTQIVGEDKGEQILVPTKTFYNFGIGYFFPKRKGLQKIMLEFTDTQAYIKKKKNEFLNLTYNHGVYSDGYRYHKKPIGSSIDADSTKFSFIYLHQLPTNHMFKLKYSNANINKNNNLKNYWGNSPRKIEALEISYTTQVTKKIELLIEYVAFRDNYLNLDNEDQKLLMRIEYLVF